MISIPIIMGLSNRDEARGWWTRQTIQGLGYKPVIELLNLVMNQSYVAVTPIVQSTVQTKSDVSFNRSTAKKKKRKKKVVEPS